MFLSQFIQSKSLYFHLSSFIIQMVFIIKPVSAQLTKDKDLFGKMDPYVLCTIGHQKQRTKTHQGGGKKPQWFDTLQFQSNGTFMKVEMYDDDFGKDDFIGQGSVNLNQLMSNPMRTQNQYVDLIFQGKSAGRVLISMEYQGQSGGNNGGWGNNQGMGGNQGGQGNGPNNNNNGWGNNPNNNGWGKGPNNNNGWGNGPNNNNGWGNGPNNGGWGNGPSNNGGWGNGPNNGWGNNAPNNGPNNGWGNNGPNNGPNNGWGNNGPNNGWGNNVPNNNGWGNNGQNNGWGNNGQNNGWGNNGQNKGW